MYLFLLSFSSFSNSVATLESSVVVKCVMCALNGLIQQEQNIERKGGHVEKGSY